MKKKNRMRHTEFLQNYTPSLTRCALCKKEGFEFYTKEKLEKYFNDAIEDLNNGYYINGCCKKNDIQYWNDQLELLNTFKG